MSDSFEKRARERRKQQKKREKAARKKDRDETKSDEPEIVELSDLLEGLPDADDSSEVDRDRAQSQGARHEDRAEPTD